MDGENRPPLNVDEFDRALADALRVDPSPAFRTQVRGRVARESMGSRWRVGAPVLVAASVAIIAMMVAFVPETSTPAPHVAMAADVTPPAAVEMERLEMPGAPTLSDPRSAQAVSRPRGSRGDPATARPTNSGPVRAVTAATSQRAGADPDSTTRTKTPEVLLSASEQAGVRLLFESAASGRLQLPPEMLQDLSLPIADFGRATEGDNQ